VPHYLDAVTSSTMRERLAQRCLDDPSVRVIGYLLGERMLEWAHAAGVATDPWLAECVPPIPPHALRSITAEIDPAMFLFTGFLDLIELLTLYRKHATVIRPRPRVLDFGCGCGRLTRFLNPEDWEISASEVNPDQVAWCRANLPDVETRENGYMPPLSFDEGEFDFVYSLSIFSHLSAAKIAAWLGELARVTTRGGIVAVTFHGPHALRIISDSSEHQTSMKITRNTALHILGRLEDEHVILLPYPDEEIALIKVGTSDYGITFLDPLWGLQLCSTIGFEPLAHVVAGLRGFHDILVLRRLG
jgi:SAM-dependent methyltransferase